MEPHHEFGPLAVYLYTSTKVQILTPEEPQGILSALEPHHEFAPLAPLKQASKRTSRRAAPEGPVGGVVLREEADEEVCGRYKCMRP